MSTLALIALLSFSPAQQVAALAPHESPAYAAANPLAAEPMFADIISRAGGLKSRVEAYRTVLTGGGSLAGLEAFKADIQRLAELNQTGSDDVRGRGVDGDLACILQGISLDLRYRMGELEKAATLAERDGALKELLYLLRDNVEVIQAPPAPPV